MDLRGSESSFCDCPFCEIVARSHLCPWLIRAAEKTLAFFPDKPVAIGHVLVIPVKHASYIWNLADEDLCALICEVKLLAKIVASAIGPSGVNIIQSNGKMAEQSVRHLHFHIVPRYENDAIYPIWPESPDIADLSKTEALRLLKSMVD